MKVYWPEAKIRIHDKIETQYTYQGFFTIQKCLECIENWDNFFHFDIVKALIKVTDDEDAAYDDHRIQE